MNRTKKAAVLAVLAASLVSSCADSAKGEPPETEKPAPVNPEPKEPVWTRFTTFGGMGAWLAEQAENYASDPYYVALSGINLRPLTDDAGNDEAGFGVLFNEFKGRYAALNLDACTGATPLYSRNYRAGEEDVPYRDRIVSVRLPSASTRVSWHSFKNCGSLKEVILPAGLLSVGEHAFENCVSLTELDLPASLIRIEGNAFKGCASLRKVVFRSREVPLLEGSEVFSGASPDLVFQVPRELYATYQRKLGSYGAVQVADGL